jgi:hypothetical protein
VPSGHKSMLRLRQQLIVRDQPTLETILFRAMT